MLRGDIYNLFPDDLERKNIASLLIKIIKATNSKELHDFLKKKCLKNFLIILIKENNMNIVNKYLQEHEIERIQIMEQLLQKLSDNFVLKGGTSLLIGYGLDRFSEDIDLDVIDPNRSIKQELTHLKIDGKQLDFSIKKDTNTTFRVMIDYGGKNTVIYMEKHHITLN